jgi:hypothetical protein
MATVRRVGAVLLLAFVAVQSLPSQEPNPDRLFVRVQTPMRDQPSTTAKQTLVLRPGALLTAVPDAPQNATFVQVATITGQRGWVPTDSVRPLAFLQAEQQLEPFGGLESVAAGRGRAPMAARGGQCQPFPSCPITGCATDPAHKITNTRKRTFPPASALIKVLTFDELDLLQALTDSRGIPQGEHLSAAERKKLSGFTIGTQDDFRRGSHRGNGIRRQ